MKCFSVFSHCIYISGLITYLLFSTITIPFISCLGCAPYTRLQRRRKLSTKKKKRPLFSQHQVQTMENEFLKNRYITENKRAELSSQLDLTETQVKTWFQNRRTKWRKELKDNGGTIDSDTHQELQSLQGAMPGKSSSQIELCLQCI